MTQGGPTNSTKKKTKKNENKENLTEGNRLKRWVDFLDINIKGKYKKYLRKVGDFEGLLK